MKPGEQKYVDQLVERCQPLVEPGQTVLTAWTSVRGIGSHKLILISWFTQVLVFLQTFRVVAVTETTVYLFSAGWFTRWKPKALVVALPRAGAVQPTGPGRFVLAGERLRVDRAFLAPLVIATAQSSPVPPVS